MRDFKQIFLFSQLCASTAFALSGTDSTGKEIPLVQSSEEKTSTDTVDYTAAHIHYDTDLGLFQLRDRASLKWKNATLKADTISYQVDAHVVEASGRPRLRDKDSPPIAGERMKFNMDSKVGQIYYGSSFRDGQQFNGMDIRRLSDQRLLVARGDFSTCDTLDDQHFYFYSRRMVINPGQSIVAKPVVLNIADVPVAILPIMANPLNKERKSGLLLPKYGGDQKQGFYLENLGYYWAANEYFDANFRLDLIEGSQGTFDQSVAKSLWQYNKRYMYNGSIEGALYLDDFSRSTKGWDLHFNHSQNLTPDNKTTLNGNGSFVSKPNLRQEQGLNKQTILEQQANAQMTLRHQFKDNSTINLDARQDKNLRPLTGQPNAYTLSRTFPSLQYSRSGNPFQSSSSDFNSDEIWYEKISYQYSGRASRYQREKSDSTGENALDTTWYGYKHDLGLSYPGTALKYFHTQLSLNESSYWTPERYQISGDSNSRQFEFNSSQGEFGTWSHLYSASFGLDTKLYGIFRPEWGRFTGIRHTLSPNLSLVAAPKLDSIPGLVISPDIQQRSGQSKQMTLNFGLGQDFDLKYLSHYRITPDSGQIPEYKNLKILNLNSSSGYNFAADSMPFRPISSNIGLQLTESERLSFNMSHSFYDRFATTALQRRTETFPILENWSFGISRSLNWNGKLFSGSLDSALSQQPWSAQLSYSFGFQSTRIAENVYQHSSSHIASASLDFKPSPYWQVNYRTQYDFLNGRFAEHSFEFNRNLHCWKLHFGWIPTGPAEGWNFQIYVIDIPDIEIHTSSQNLKR